MLEPKSDTAYGRVFISYSRSDGDFADRLLSDLSAKGVDAYLDKYEIDPGEVWRDRLASLIAEADRVIFCISPTSVASTVCAWELDHAERLGKSILPVACRDTPNEQVPGRISRLNYVFMRNEAEHESSLPIVVDVLRRDIAWERERTRLNRFIEVWQTGKQARMLLSEGASVAEAEHWRDSYPVGAAPLTSGELEFITASRRRVNKGRWLSSFGMGITIAASLIVVGAFSSGIASCITPIFNFAAQVG